MVNVSHNFSLGQGADQNQGPHFMYAGNPEGFVSAQPGSICFNLNSGTEGKHFYMKVYGTGKYGWAPEGRAPRAFNIRVGAVTVDDQHFLMVAPIDMTIMAVALVVEAATDSAVGQTWTVQLVNHTLGVDLLAAAKSTLDEEFLPYREWLLAPDQNKFVRAGDVLELDFDITGAPGPLNQLNVVVLAYEGGTRNEIIQMLQGDVTTTDQRFLCRVPRRGWVKKVTLAVDTAIAADAVNHKSHQITNFTGPADLLAAAQVLDGGLVANTEYEIVCDQNQRVEMGDVLEHRITDVAGGGDNYSQIISTVHMEFDDRDEVGAFTSMTTYLGAAVNATEEIVLGVMPFDGTVSQVYIIEDTGIALHAANYWEFQVQKRKLLSYVGTDPHPLELGSVLSTTETGEPGALAFTANTPRSCALNQNLAFKKGDVLVLIATKYAAAADLNNAVVALEIHPG